MHVLPRYPGRYSTVQYYSTAPIQAVVQDSETEYLSGDWLVLKRGLLCEPAVKQNLPTILLVEGTYLPTYLPAEMPNQISHRSRKQQGNIST